MSKKSDAEPGKPGSGWALLSEIMRTNAFFKVFGAILVLYGLVWVITRQEPITTIARILRPETKHDKDRAPEIAGKPGAPALPGPVVHVGDQKIEQKGSQEGAIQGSPGATIQINAPPTTAKTQGPSH
jgi:hypothetical protein